MNSKVSKSKNQKEASAKKKNGEIDTTSYRLKCAKTANGLSHYVMYGDVDKKEALL